MDIRKVVIPVAGWGTRSLPASKNIPKEMLPIYNKPTVQYVVEEAVASGAQDIIFITNKDKQVIEDYFDHNFQLERLLELSGKNELLTIIKNIAETANIISIRQKRQLGLGHAVLCAKSVIRDEPFAVMLGDDLLFSPESNLSKLMRAAQLKNTSVVGVMEVPPDKIDRYGIISGAEIAPNLYRVTDMTEKPPVGSTSSRLAVIGRYALTPDIFQYLESAKPGHGGEIQLTDALLGLANDKGLLAVKLDGLRFDAGDWTDYLSANVYLAMKDKRIAKELQTKLQDILQDLK